MASPAVLAKLQRTGQGVLPPAAALSALGSLLSSLPSACPPCPPVVTVNPFSWPRYIKQMGGQVPPVFTEFAGGHQGRRGGAGAKNGEEVSGGGAAGARGGSGRGGQGRREGRRRWERGEVEVRVEEVARRVVGSSVGREEPLMAAGG